MEQGIKEKSLARRRKSRHSTIHFLRDISLKVSTQRSQETPSHGKVWCFGREGGNPFRYHPDIGGAPPRDIRHPKSIRDATAGEAGAATPQPDDGYRSTEILRFPTLRPQQPFWTTGTVQPSRFVPRYGFLRKVWECPPTMRSTFRVSRARCLSSP